MPPHRRPAGRRRRGRHPRPPPAPRAGVDKIEVSIPRAAAVFVECCRRRSFVADERFLAPRIRNRPYERVREVPASTGGGSATARHRREDVEADETARPLPTSREAPRDEATFASTGAAPHTKTATAAPRCRVPRNAVARGTREHPWLVPLSAASLRARGLPRRPGCRRGPGSRPGPGCTRGRRRPCGARRSARRSRRRRPTRRSRR